ncbi:SsrA-binding protein SmpB [bacterium]|nr:SsrA-binding protein SmpB [bacterium]
MTSTTPVIKNRKARHDYHIEETFEAGLVLYGTEVKSVRQGSVTLRDAHVEFDGNQATVIGINIASYSHRGYSDHHTVRPRKLLLHKKEIKRLARKVLEKGLTIIPLKMYFNDRGYVKVELGLARGKREYDKRQTISKREADREMKRARKEIDRWKS